MSTGLAAGSEPDHRSSGRLRCDRCLQPPDHRDLHRLGGAFRVSAMMALANTATDKVAYCAQFGIAIQPEDWPAHHLPGILLGDRGEIESEKIDTLINSFNVTVENTSSYRADWKGVVESRFRLLPAKFKAYTPGYIDVDYRQRGGTDYRLDAVLNRMISPRSSSTASSTTTTRTRSSATTMTGTSGPTVFHPFLRSVGVGHSPPFWRTEDLSTGTGEVQPDAEGSGVRYRNRNRIQGPLLHLQARDGGSLVRQGPPGWSLEGGRVIRPARHGHDLPAPGGGQDGIRGMHVDRP